MTSESPCPLRREGEEGKEIRGYYGGDWDARFGYDMIFFTGKGKKKPFFSFSFKLMLQKASLPFFLFLSGTEEEALLKVLLEKNL